MQSKTLPEHWSLQRCCLQFKKRLSNYLNLIKLGLQYCINTDMDFSGFAPFCCTPLWYFKIGKAFLETRNPGHESGYEMSLTKDEDVNLTKDIFWDICSLSSRAATCQLEPLSRAVRQMLRKFRFLSPWKLQIL